MIKFTLRVDDDELVERIDDLAKAQGKTRTRYITELMEQAVERDYVPTRDGEGFRAITDKGGEVTLIRHDRYVSGGMAGLDSDENAAYERAREVTTPENGSQWKKARIILENAGFHVFMLSTPTSQSA
jgi:predicted transcriptional regulator